MVKQGDIIKVEGIGVKLLVVSQNLINENEVCIVVPLSSKFRESATHIRNSFSKELLITEQLRYLDLTARFYKHLGTLSVDEMVNVVDVVQGLFDYY